MELELFQETQWNSNISVTIIVFVNLCAKKNVYFFHDIPQKNRFFIMFWPRGQRTKKHLISSGAQAKGIKRWDATIHLLRIVWGYFMGLYGI